MLFYFILSFNLFAQVNLLTDKSALEKAQFENQKLLKALVDCKPHEYRHSSPIIKKNALISKVYGLQKDQTCLYTQTLPHGALKTCYFTSKHRLTIKTDGQKGLNQFMTDPKVCKDSGSNL